MTATQEYIAYLEWDESKIFEREIEYRIENWVEFYDARPSEDDVLDDVSGDCDIFRWEYEDLLYDLSELLKDWLGEPLLATVSNFGWRNSSGYANITAENAGDLLRKVLPNTDCTFRIWIYSDQVRIQNFHHDSPMGNEWYTIYKTADLCRQEAKEYKNIFRLARQIFQEFRGLSEVDYYYPEDRNNIEGFINRTLELEEPDDVLFIALK